MDRHTGHKRPRTLAVTVPLIAAAIALSGNGLRGPVQPAGTVDFPGYLGEGIFAIERQGPGSTLHIGIVSTMDFIPMPPALLPDGPERWIMEQVYGPGLILPPLKGVVEPALIIPQGGFIEGEAANEFHFKLISGITFHDGEELTVDHFKRTYELFKRLASTSYGHSEVDPAFAYIDEIVINRDENSIIIRMPGRMRDQLLRIAATAPLHSRFLDAAPGSPDDPWNSILSEANDLALGLGAYNFEYDPARRIIHLLEYRNYFDGRPNIRQISIHLYQKDQELIQAFITGDVQMVRLPTYKAYGTIRSESEGSGLTDIFGMVNERFYPQPNHFFYLAFNTTKEPLNIPNMRRALAFAIKRTDLDFRDEPPGMSVLADVPLHPDSRLGQKAQKARQYLPRAGALRIIRDISAISHTRTGYPRNAQNERFTLNLIYPDHVSHYETLARGILNDLGNLELQIEVTPLSPQELRKRIETGDYDLAISEMTLPPTVDYFQRLFTSVNARSGLNFTRYVNEEFDTAVQGAMARLRGIRPEYNRQPYIRTFLKHLFDEVPMLPLFFQANQYYFFNNLFLDVEQLGPIGERLAPMSDWRLK